MQTGNQLNDGVNTFADFRASRMFVPKVPGTIAPDLFGDEPYTGPVAGFIYDGGLDIFINPGSGDYAFLLLIDNEIWESNDLRELERILFDEMYAKGAVPCTAQ